LRTTEHSPCGGFCGVAGLHFRTRSARPSVPSRNTAKEPTKQNKIGVENYDAAIPQISLRRRMDSLQGACL
jgi:hypothetical protein